MHDARHCHITAGRHTFAGLVVAELDWHAAAAETGHTAWYAVTDPRLVEFPLMDDRLKDYVYDSSPDDGVIDIDITIGIDGMSAGATLDGVIDGGRLTQYTLDLGGAEIDDLLARAFND